MKLHGVIMSITLFVITMHHSVFAQTISKDEILFLTSEWKGERFADES
jgi:hypothetical protein